jgi:hypothetical protein
VSRCGCATIHKEIGPGAPQAAFGRVAASPLPLSVRSRDPLDPALPVEITVFTRRGALDSLEIAHNGGRPTGRCPDPIVLEVFACRDPAGVSARRTEPS